MELYDTACRELIETDTGVRTVEDEATMHFLGRELWRSHRDGAFNVQWRYWATES